MSIEFIENVEIYDLGEHLWGQGLSNYKEICEADKEALKEYIKLLECMGAEYREVA